MIAGMSARAAAVAELVRTELATADRLDPVERDAIYAALVTDPERGDR